MFPVLHTDMPTVVLVQGLSVIQYGLGHVAKWGALCYISKCFSHMMSTLQNVAH